MTSIAERSDMEKIASLFGAYQQPSEKRNRTERGDLLEAFLSRLNPGRKAKGYPPLSHGRLAYLLTGIKTADLYYLLSVCNDAERRGYNWGAIFWKEIKAPQSSDV
jgi:hypothetical protein